MTFTANQIALLINGKVDGDANAAVSSFGKIEEAKASFLALHEKFPNDKVTQIYLDRLQ